MMWDHKLQFWGTVVEWCLQAVLDPLPKGRVLHREAGKGASGRSFNSGDPARARDGTAAAYRHVVFLTFCVPEEFKWEEEEVGEGQEEVSELEHAHRELRDEDRIPTSVILQGGVELFYANLQ